MKKIVVMSIISILFIVPVTVSADLADSPWPMFRGDLLHTGRSLFSGSTVNTLKWQFKTNDTVNSSPVIGVDGTIYIGSDDNGLYAVTPDGVKKWKYKTGAKVISTPAIASDGTIYVGSDDDKLHAINPDGTLKWKYKTNNRVQSSPAIAPDGTIYVGSNDGYVHAVNPDGTRKWKFDAGGDVFSSPAITPDGTIYVGSTNGKLFALNPDGTRKWKFDTDGQFNTSPAIAPDGTIYAGSSEGYLYAINPADGTKMWRFDLNGNVFSSPAIGVDGTIYVGCNDDKFLAINPDGTKKWQFGTNNVFESSPIISADGIIYVGCNDDKLYALNPDGTKLWHYNTDGRVFSSPAIGSDGTIYVGSKQRLIAIGSPSGPQVKTLSLPTTSGIPGQTLEVPVNINDAGGIKSGEITITYDSDILTAGEAQKTDLSSQCSIESEITAGQIHITLSSSSPLSGGTGVFITIPFTVTNTATGTSFLTFTETQLKDGEGNVLDVTVINGSFTAEIEEGVRVSIPDVSGHPGEMLSATIVVNEATGILAGDFTITYDQSKVTAGSASTTTLTSDFTIVSSVSGGEIRVSIASSSPILTDSGPLVSIPLTINADAEGSSPLSLTQAVLYNESYQEIEIITQNGTLTILPVCLKGDVNNDGSITSVDAALVLQISVGLIEPDGYQQCAGDVNGDGMINSLDASMILQCAAGNCPFVMGEGRIFRTSSLQAKMVTVSIPDVTGKANSSITVPINLDDATSIMAGDLTVNYDPDVLTATSVETTILTAPFSIVANITSGEIRMSLASASPIMNGSGALIEIAFLVPKKGKKYSPLDLSEVSLYDQHYQNVQVSTEDGSFKKKRK